MKIDGLDDGEDGVGNVDDSDDGVDDGKVGNEPNESNIRGSLLVSSRTNQHFFARSPQRAERRPDAARSLGQRAARLARSARSWDIW